MRPCLAFAVLLSCAMPFLSGTALSQEAGRQITGSLMLGAPIEDLPGTAQAVVELRSADGALIAEQRLPPPSDGGSVAFALELPGMAGGRLRAGILDGGSVLWTSPAMRIDSGTEDAALETLVLSPHVPMGIASTLSCGTRAVDLGFVGEGAVLRSGDETFRLASVPAASGARFSDGADSETWVHARGSAALVSIRGETLPECREALPDSIFPLRASGNEPFWALLISVARGILLDTPGGSQVLSETLLEPERIPGGLRFAGDLLSVEIEAGLCRDTMTGMPHPFAVRLTTAELSGEGCGGAPLSLLGGVEWQIEEIEGEMTGADAEVTLAIDPAGRLAGRAGCNRYMGSFILTGEGLSFGPLASTRMACAEPLMEIEARFLDAMGRVDRFDFDESGALVLIGADSPLVRATR